MSGGTGSRHIYLVGFMGAGKTTVGQKLSDRLGMPLVDLDSRIESRAGRPVRQIFAEEGEGGFRRLESEELRSLAEEPPSVVAGGGGVVLADENSAFMKDTGTIVYLKVTAEEALARVGGGETRPLLSGKGGLMADSLLKARENIYASVADMTVDTVGQTADEVVDVVVRTLPQEEA